MQELTYRKSGVDIKKGDEFAKGISSLFPKSKISKISAFGSLFDIKPFAKACKSPVLVSSADGVGTKLMLAQLLNIHNNIGIDLVAMNVNDIVCLGAKPLFFLDYIACGKLKPKTLLEVVKGIKKGLDEAGCCLLGGETAEMPDMYRHDDYDLAGFCVGVVDKVKIINGSKIKQGDLIIGLESSGLHSNGFSLVRKVFFKHKDLKKYSRELLAPTRIYVKPVLSLLSAIKNNQQVLKGIAHITGGAFYSKATKILPSSLGMAIDTGSWKVPKIFEVIQARGRISDKEMYSVFNMGIGMMLVVNKKYAGKVLNNISKKCKSRIIGEVVKSKKRMILV